MAEALAFRGDQVLVADDDGTARIWDPELGWSDPVPAAAALERPGWTAAADSPDKVAELERRVQLLEQQGVTKDLANLDVNQVVAATDEGTGMSDTSMGDGLVDATGVGSVSREEFDALVQRTSQLEERVSTLEEAPTPDQVEQAIDTGDGSSLQASAGGSLEARIRDLELAELDAAATR